MSYAGIDALTRDAAFGGRVTACAIEQAYETYQKDADLANVGLANDVMRGGATLATFTRFVAEAPGLADKAEGTDDVLDQTRVVDSDILAAVEASWPTIAGLHFDSKGNRIA